MENKKQSFYVCIVTQWVIVALHATDNTANAFLCSKNETIAQQKNNLWYWHSITQLQSKQKAIFSSYKSSLLIASTKWRVEEKYCVKAEENGLKWWGFPSLST